MEKSEKMEIPAILGTNVGVCAATVAGGVAAAYVGGYGISVGTAAATAFCLVPALAITAGASLVA